LKGWDEWRGLKREFLKRLVLLDNRLSIIKQLAQDEDRALINADLALNMTVFKYLACAISTSAIRMVEKEWLEL
jgi:hypothetical protein